MDDKLIIPVKHLKGEDGYKTFSIRIRTELVQTLDEMAQKSGRSRNELIGILLEYAISKSDIVKE